MQFAPGQDSPNLAVNGFGIGDTIFEFDVVKQVALMHPALGAFKHFLRIGLRHNAFAVAKTSDIDSST